MTDEIQTTRYDQLIRRVAGIIGPGSKVAEVITELFPMIDVENVPGELLRLSGTFIAFGGASITGAAGQSGRVQLFNPADSGNLITVSHVDVGVDASQTVRYGVGTIALTTGVATQVHRDTRTPITQRPIGQIRTQSSVALAPATGQVRLLANSTFRVFDPNGVAVLLPGSGLEVGASNNATLVVATFFWRERVAQESELSV